MTTKAKVAPVGRPGSPVCSVSGPLMLVLRVSQLAGAAPLTFHRRGREWTVTVSKRKSLLSFIFGVILNVVAWVGFAKDLYQNWTTTDMFALHPTRLLTWSAEMLVMMMTSSIAVFGGPHRLRKTILCLRTIQKINKADSKEKSENMKGKLVFVVWFLTTVLVIITDITDFTVVSARLSGIPEMTLMVPFYYGNVLLLLLQMQFVFSAVELSSTMAVLHDLIRDLDQILDAHYAPNAMAFGFSTKSIPNKSVNKIIDNISTINVDSGYTVAPTTKSICESIRRLASMYEETCNVVRQLDSCHATGVMFVLLALFWRCIIVLYELITLSVSKLDGWHVLRTTVQLFWVMNDFLCTAAMMEPGHRTLVEDSRVRLLVSRMVLKCPEAAVLSELEKFSRYLLANQPTYYPLGVCALTRPLVASIIGSVVTYMVIIIQFQLSEH